MFTESTVHSSTKETITIPGLVFVASILKPIYGQKVKTIVITKLKPNNLIKVPQLLARKPKFIDRIVSDFLQKVSTPL